MMHLGEGTNDEVIFIFTAGVMFDSSMPLVRWPIGKVYLALGVGYISLY